MSRRHFRRLACDRALGLGRSGVPVSAHSAPGAAEPQLLSEILSVAEIRTALAGWPNRASASKPASNPPPPT